ncbi:MAG: hypothetical protein GC184_03835 [Rhizobiales bacterium]|nr:hypothetical protein [Hyphomicrobiales bacterium]
MPGLNSEMISAGQQRSGERPSGIWDQGLFLALLAMIALAPLPLGSNRPLPAALLCLSAGLLLILWAARNLGGGPMPVSPRRIWLPLLLYAMTCVWIFIQWLPLGIGDPVWRIAAEVTGQDLSSRISVNPDETLAGLLRLICYGAIFWLSLQLGYTAKRADQALRAITLISVAYAAYGLCIYLAGNEWLLFYKKWTYQTSLSSTFVNRNSYATFAGLGLLLITARLLMGVRQTLSLNWPLQQRIARLIEHLLVDSVWLTACFLVTLVALMLTGSRAGIASTAAALLILGGIFLIGKKLSVKNLSAIFLVITGISALAYFLGSQTLVQRYESRFIVESGQGRLEVWSYTLSALKSAPWTGTGFGTFENVIPAYRTIDSSILTKWDKAHNTYLENALELGLPAALALNLAIALLAWRSWRGTWDRQRGWLWPALGLCATALVGLHSTVDFSLQMPAVAVFYAFILGIAVSQSWSRQRKDR